MHASCKHLLREDGVVFVSIGKDELANQRLFCDDVYGSDNFFAIITRVMKSGSVKGNFFTPNIDYILAYARNLALTRLFRLCFSEKVCEKPMNLDNRIPLAAGQPVAQPFADCTGGQAASGTSLLTHFLRTR